jgi:hypothetical protein
MSRIEVTVTVGDKKVTLDGPEDFVRAEVQRLTNVIASSDSSHSPASTGVSLRPMAEHELPPTEKEFIAAKKPAGHAETVAVLAYYLTKSGQQDFTPEDIRRAYVRAEQRPPKVISQALRDAKNQHDYLEKGSGPSIFRLSPHGERTVIFDLPRKLE